jgi:hypothetical protein
MKNIIDFILESNGQRISRRANNRPYDVKNDKLLKNRDSRPERAQKLRKTKVDKQVQEFCSALVNDFMVKFYNLTKADKSLLSFYYESNDILTQMDKDNALNDIEPETKRSAGGCVFLHSVKTDSEDNRIYKDLMLQYDPSSSFTTILNNLEFYYKCYYCYDWGREEIEEDEEHYKFYIKYKPKFFASVLHRLRKHDLAKRAEDGRAITLFDLFDDVADNYNKNYFADKFKEIETAYNDILSNW